jgi:hypothetical protein
MNVKYSVLVQREKKNMNTQRVTRATQSWEPLTLHYVAPNGGIFDELQRILKKSVPELR